MSDKTTTFRKEDMDWKGHRENSGVLETPCVDLGDDYIWTDSLSSIHKIRAHTNLLFVCYTSLNKWITISICGRIQCHLV